MGKCKCGECALFAYVSKGGEKELFGVHRLMVEEKLLVVIYIVPYSHCQQLLV